MNKTVIFDWVTRPDGTSLFVEFLQSLREKDRAKLLATIAKIEEHGLLIATRQEWVKKLDDHIYEIRSQHSNNIQRVCYFHVQDTHYIITHGFTKKKPKNAT